MTGGASHKVRIVTTPATPVPAVQSTRFLAYAFTAAPIVVGIALTFVAKPANGESGKASVTAVAAEVVVAALLALTIEAFGYRLPPLPSTMTGAEARSAALARYLPAMFLRFALAETVVLLSVALTFVFTPISVLNYVVGGALGMLLLVLHVWPNTRVLARCQTALDRDGGRCELAEQFSKAS